MTRNTHPRPLAQHATAATASTTWTALRAWTAMHPVHLAVLVWAAAVPITLATARTTVPPLFATTPSGSVPTALLIPLLGAGGLAFATHHQAPLLLNQATRPVLPTYLAWLAAGLVPVLLLAVLAAEHSGHITPAAAIRNALLATALTVAATTVLPPGLATVPVLGYDLVCLMYAVNTMVLGLPTPWWAVALDHTATTTQLLTASGLVTLAAVLAGHHQTQHTQHRHR